MLNAYFPLGQTTGRMRIWWRALHGHHASLDDEHRREMAGSRCLDVYKIVQVKRCDLTVFKIKWGDLTLKIYDKGARVLRIEVVVHNAKKLRSGKVWDSLTTLLTRMKDMLVLDTVYATHISFLTTTGSE